MPTYRVVKNRKNPYMMMDKHMIYDEGISWKAKGILAYFLSRPDNWTFHEIEINKHSRDGRHGTRSGITELIEKGYIKRIQERNENGKFQGYIYEVYERPFEERENPETDNRETEDPKSDLPFSENPITDNPITGKPMSGNRTLLINDNSNNDSNNNDLNNNDFSKEGEEEKTLGDRGNTAEDKKADGGEGGEWSEDII